MRFGANVGSERELKLLFQYGAHIGYGDLVGAARGGHLGVQNGADCNEADAYGNTALYHAVRNKHPMMVYLLLEHGADPRICNPFACRKRGVL